MINNNENSVIIDIHRKNVNKIIVLINTEIAVLFRLSETKILVLVMSIDLMCLYDTYCTQSEHDHSLIINVIFLSIQMQSVRIPLKLIWRRANGLTIRLSM